MSFRPCPLVEILISSDGGELYGMDSDGFSGRCADSTAYYADHDACNLRIGIVMRAALALNIFAVFLRWCWHGSLR